MLTIPKTYADLPMECPVCFTREWAPSKPDVVYAHLIERHQYASSEAMMAVHEWIENFPIIGDDIPAYTCSVHGEFPAEEMECPGCSAIDLEIDYWIERRHAMGGAA